MRSEILKSFPYVWEDFCLGNISNYSFVLDDSQILRIHWMNRIDIQFSMLSKYFCGMNEELDEILK